MGLDAYVCSDRFSRLRTYGYYNYTNYPVSASKGPVQTNWNEVNWGSLQTQCFERNAGRYSQIQTQPRPITHSLPARPISRSPTMNIRRGRYKTPPSDPRHKARSAVILRAWHDMEWTDNLKQSVRSLVMELSLHSGAEYEVFILCHVKDASIPLNTDDAEAMRNLKSRFIPREFQEMAVLFNDKTLESWYLDINDHRYSTTSPTVVNSLAPNKFIARYSNTGNQSKFSLNHSKTLIITGNSKWILNSPAMSTTSLRNPRNSQKGRHEDISGSGMHTSTSQGHMGPGGTLQGWWAPL